MEFDLADHQLVLRDDAMRFGAALYEDRSNALIEADADGYFDRTIWNTCAAERLLGLHAPREFGGRDLGSLDTVLALEGFGQGCADNGLVFAVSAQLVSVVDTLVRFASIGLKDSLVAQVIQGKRIGCYAITEANAGSDCFALETTATADGDGWLINGAKELITFAPIADFAIVFAMTDSNAGPFGLSVFVVDCTSDGVSKSSVQQKMGLRTVPIGSLAFDNVRVDASACIGSVGAGASIFNSGQETERALILAGQVGTMQRQLDETISFARKRKQFGQAIGGFQSVSNRIVDMRLQIETCRLLLYKTAWLRDQGKSHMLEASLTNMHLAESAMQSSLDALTIRGGRGYLTENSIERHVRDAIGGSLYGGTSDIQRQIVARLLGL